MSVVTMYGVNAAYTAMGLGGLLLLTVAMWWSWVGDGIEVERERWPGAIRLAAVAGWGLFMGGIVGQLVAYFGPVGVARFSAMISGAHH
jgi:hypothetical protein